MCSNADPPDPKCPESIYKFKPSQQNLNDCFCKMRWKVTSSRFAVAGLFPAFKLSVKKTPRALPFFKFIDPYFIFFGKYKEYLEVAGMLG